MSNTIPKTPVNPNKVAGVTEKPFVPTESTLNDTIAIVPPSSIEGGNEHMDKVIGKMFELNPDMYDFIYNLSTGILKFTPKAIIDLVEKTAVDRMTMLEMIGDLRDVLIGFKEGFGSFSNLTELQKQHFSNFMNNLESKVNNYELLKEKAINEKNKVIAEINEKRKDFQTTKDNWKLSVENKLEIASKSLFNRSHWLGALVGKVPHGTKITVTGLLGAFGYGAYYIALTTGLL